MKTKRGGHLYWALAPIPLLLSNPGVGTRLLLFGSATGLLSCSLSNLDPCSVFSFYLEGEHQGLTALRPYSSDLQVATVFVWGTTGHNGRRKRKMQFLKTKKRVSLFGYTRLLPFSGISIIARILFLGIHFQHCLAHFYCFVSILRETERAESTGALVEPGIGWRQKHN